MDLVIRLAIILKQDGEKYSKECRCCHHQVKVLLLFLRILQPHYSQGPHQNLFVIHSLSLPLHLMYLQI
jgi:hypothetical protein